MRGGTIYSHLPEDFFPESELFLKFGFLTVCDAGKWVAGLLPQVQVGKSGGAPRLRCKLKPRALLNKISQGSLRPEFIPFLLMSALRVASVSTDVGSKSCSCSLAQWNYWAFSPKLSGLTLGSLSLISSPVAIPGFRLPHFCFNTLELESTCHSA